MADIIQLLPDSIANQIAAGEVIQRPASVVKELLENAIDSGANEIRVIIKDAGKTLIQIIDNGCGMSETDARMAFERHATSKIRTSNDLFEIRTMGFRGEALASIAAIAHVELKTRQHKNDIGTKILIEGSEVKKQEACQTAPGTSFSIKNLFYNVPARRKFLKSDSVETRHILDEFQRVAISNADVFFSFHSNENELFHLPKGNLRQRLVAIFGNNYNKRLVPVGEETDVIKIEGFVGKPEFAKKTRGDQYFFVNNRFIKSSYFNHAILSAYENLIQEKTHPFYVIFMEIDPARIDINVHPTKQEINFEDKVLIYNYLKVAVRHALGQYAVMPTIDFDAETSLSGFQTAASPTRQAGQNAPFRGSGSNQSWSNVTPQSDQTRQIEANNLKNWQKLFEGVDIADDSPEPTGNQESITIASAATSAAPELGESEFDTSKKEPFQIQNTYIVSHIKSGFLLIDQQSAHERILYERILKQLEGNNTATQKELFARTIEMTPADFELMKSILPQVNSLGFEIEEFGNNSFVIHGIPADMRVEQNETFVLEQLLEQYKSNLELKLDVKENLARAMARSASIKRGKSLSELEMQSLIDQLFACAMPFTSPYGKKCFINYDMDDLQKQFEG